MSCTKYCQDNSFISVVPASTEYQLAVQALTDEIHQRRDAVLHRSHSHQKSSLEREEEHESPRRADPASRATTAVQYRVRLDGWSLRGRPTPSPQESVEKGCGQTHQVHALTSPTSCLDGSVTRGPGRYPQYTRADFGPEAVCSSNHRHIMSPNVEPCGRVKSRMFFFFFLIFDFFSIFCFCTFFLFLSHFFFWQRWTSRRHSTQYNTKLSGTPSENVRSVNSTIAH